MGEIGHTHQFLLVSKGSLADNGVLWVAPEYGKITGDLGVLNRVVGTLRDKVPIVLPEDLPFEEIPGYIIGDEPVLSGMDRIKPLEQRQEGEFVLSSALEVATDSIGTLDMNERRVVKELISKFPIP